MVTEHFQFHPDTDEHGRALEYQHINANCREHSYCHVDDGSDFYACPANCHRHTYRPANSNADASAGQRPLHDSRP